LNESTLAMHQSHKTASWTELVVVLYDPFQGMEERRNSAETQQSRHEIKDESSSAKEGAPERANVGQSRKWITPASAARWVLSSYPS